MPELTLEELMEPTEADQADNDNLVMEIIRECRLEAEKARETRDELTRQNYRAYFGEQDWSHKQDGQSTEFLPKVAEAAEQLAAFVERGLIASGNWFQVELTPSPIFAGQPLNDSAIRKLLRNRLERISDHAPELNDFPTVLADGIKMALLGSLVVLKVHGYTARERRPFVEQEPVYQMIQDPVSGQTFQQPMGLHDRLMIEERDVWHLAIEAVRPEDYYPDPSGRCLYEIHRTERDLHEVLAMADQGIYDRTLVADIEQTFVDHDRRYREHLQTGQDEVTPPSFRKKVILDEFWGTLVDRDGQVIAKNIVATLANDQFLIRRPEPNPFWHQESPFVVAPLVRVPGSVWHKALLDHATQLNFAINELFNLMLDGGIASVWGIRQVKMSSLENAKDFADGIPQGATLLVKEDVPDNVDVYKRVDTGEVPNDALNMFNLLDREFQVTSKVNDAKLGLLPPRQVKATEILDTAQQSAVIFDAIVSDLENRVIKQVLRKGWLTMLQNFEAWSTDDVVGCLGPQQAMQLAAMGPARRFAMFAQGCRFKVDGLSAMLTRVKEFQKLMALLQSVSANAILLQAFVQRFSPEKILDRILKVLAIDPDTLAMTEEERASLQQRMQELAFFNEIVQGTGARRGQGGGAGLSAQSLGDTQLPGQINQLETNPTAGMV